MLKIKKIIKIKKKLPSQTKNRSLMYAHFGECKYSNIVLLYGSICKDINHIWDLQLLAYPGTGVYDVIALVKANRIPELKNKPATIIHVGRNNLQAESEQLIAQKDRSMENTDV